MASDHQVVGSNPTESAKFFYIITSTIWKVDMTKHFAYGSNLWFKQMDKRCDENKRILGVLELIPRRILVLQHPYIYITV